MVFRVVVMDFLNAFFCALRTSEDADMRWWWKERPDSDQVAIETRSPSAHTRITAVFILGGCWRATKRREGGSL